MLSTDVALHLDETPAGLCVFSGVLLNQEEWKARAASRKVSILSSLSSSIYLTLSATHLLPLVVPIY